VDSCWHTSDQAVRCNNPFNVFQIFTPHVARFWGWSENKREYDRDLEELSQLAREGKPLYGESNQPEWVQGAAFRNSQWSQLKFCEYTRSLINRTTTQSEYCSRVPHVRLTLCLYSTSSNNLPRFNFVNHPHHGTDPAKYGVKKEDSQ
jgi:hypothetical protein